jgi:hypothetical protein
MTSSPEEMFLRATVVEELKDPIRSIVGERVKVKGIKRFLQGVSFTR